MAQEINPYELDICRPHFDSICYLDELKKHKINIEPDTNLLEHFFHFGSALYLNPCRWFSTQYYLHEYGDVAKAKINPFFHFIVAGEAEGRIPNAYVNKFDAVINILKPQTSLEEESSHWIKSRQEITALSIKELQSLLKTEAESILSLSHDFFMKNPGGVQLCIKREMTIAKEKGLRYIHIFPFQPLPGLNLKNNAGFLVGLSIDGEFAGYANLKEFFSALTGKFKFIVIHSVLGFNLVSLVLLMKSLNASKFYYWTHDYLPFCPSWTLMRNKIVFCGSPSPNSQSCSLCYYGQSRNSHVQQFKLFFSYLNFEFIFPSNNVKENYEDFTLRNNFKMQKLHVLPHMTLNNPIFGNRKRSTKMKIAFLGHPAFHKGWEEFMSIFFNKSLSSKIDFYHLASHQTNIGLGLKYINVNTTESGMNAMSDAIKQNEIDFCLLWSHWPETFGITAIEAIKGGARILTNTKSGNTYEVAKSELYGKAFNDIDELIAWLNSVYADESRWDELKFTNTVDITLSELSFSPQVN
jgi:hypothetical protein